MESYVAPLRHTECAHYINGTGMGSLSDQLRHLFSGAQLPWMIVWLGLAVLIIGLIVLTRTSWGQSHPLQKCAAMSLLVHLLLAVYATTVQIVAAGSPEGTSDRAPVNLRLVNDGGDVSQDPTMKPPNPLDQLLAGSPVNPESAGLSHLETLPAAPLGSTPNSDPLADTKPLLDRLSATITALTKPASDPTPSAVSAAAPIDIATPIRPLPSLTPQPDAASPPRQSLTADSQSSHTSAGPKPQATTPGPDTTTPATEVPVDKIAEQFSAANDKAAKPVPLGPAPIEPIANSKSSATSAPPMAKASTSKSDGPNSSSSGESRIAMVPVNGSSATAATRGASSGTVGAASEPAVYRDRTASDRPGIVRRHGGSPETEAAVQAALTWLATNQSSDGHWDAERFGAGREDYVLGQNRNGAGRKANTGVTGLALLAMLGSGNTHLDGPFADNVRRGLNYLLTAQGTDGNLGGQAESFAFMYSHGIASFAMSEDYAMTRDRRLEKPLRAAIGFTVAAQQPIGGGWRYQRHETMGDTSQLGWQLMALKSAELAGIPMPDATRAGIVRFLKSVEAGSSGGLASYRPGEAPSRPMTAEALVCRQFLGLAHDDPAAGEAADYLLGELPNGQRVNLYFWYYGTCAMYQMQGDHWRRWNEALQAALVDQQLTTGDMAGSWDPKCIWGGYGGRVYSTAMSALCLEVYYRYLPVFGGEK